MTATPELDASLTGAHPTFGYAASTDHLRAIIADAARAAGIPNPDQVADLIATQLPAAGFTVIHPLPAGQVTTRTSDEYAVRLAYSQPLPVASRHSAAALQESLGYPAGTLLGRRTVSVRGPWVTLHPEEEPPA